jgi:hypothetical protein
MDTKLQDKINIESNVWTQAMTFKLCKDRVLKNPDFSKPNSGVASEEELRQFSNCVTKSFKSIVLFPSVL